MPLKFKSEEELRLKIENYFHQCNIDEEPYTMTGLALALGTTRKTLADYAKKDEYGDIIVWARTMCENYAEKQLFIGKNPAGVIFNMKNNYGWQNQDKLDMTTGGEKISGFNYLPPKKDEANDTTDN